MLNKLLQYRNCIAWFPALALSLRAMENQRTSVLVENSSWKLISFIGSQDTSDNTSKYNTITELPVQH